MRCLSARIPIHDPARLDREACARLTDAPSTYICRYIDIYIYVVVAIIVAVTLTISATNSVLHGISWYLVGTGDHDHVLEINYAFSNRKL